PASVWRRSLSFARNQPVGRRIEAHPAETTVRRGSPDPAERLTEGLPISAHDLPEGRYLAPRSPAATTGSMHSGGRPSSGDAAAAQQGLLHLQVVLHAVVGDLLARDARGKLPEVGDLERAGRQVDPTPIGRALAVDLDPLHGRIGQVTAAQVGDDARAARPVDL